VPVPVGSHGRCHTGGILRHGHGLLGLPRSDHIQRRIDRRPAQIAFGISQRLGIAPPPQQSQKNRL